VARKRRIVFYGGLTIEQFPFVSPEPVNPLFGQAFTFFALVGMINAANHSDGLDGLAGGLTLMSLLMVGALAYHADGRAEVITALAVTGGILGFLRYNTHPAVVFMGDSGSQFLGLTSGFLAVVLTQRVNPALSPALPALLLGLPVVDILAVFYLRVTGGMNWFKATRNHIHHRLLDVGFCHQSTVVMIYSIQFLFVSSAVLLRYQPDAVVLTVYLAGVVAVFAGLVAMERHVAVKGVSPAAGLVTRAVRQTLRSDVLRRAPFVFLAFAVPLYFLAVTATEENVTRDFGAVAAVLAVMLGLDAVRNRLRGSIASRIAIFTLVVYSVYLWGVSPPAFLAHAELARKGFFAVVAVAVGLVLKLARDVDFRTTALDYLAVFLVVLVSLSPLPSVLDGKLAAIVVKSMILLYACEVLLSRRTRAPIPLYVGSMVALAILAWEGLL